VTAKKKDRKKGNTRKKERKKMQTCPAVMPGVENSVTPVSQPWTRNDDVEIGLILCKQT